MLDGLTAYVLSVSERVASGVSRPVSIVSVVVVSLVVSRGVVLTLSSFLEYRTSRSVHTYSFDTLLGEGSLREGPGHEELCSS